MNPPLRIAMFVGSFPVVSETFIVRQIAGLLDLGHDVDIYADTRGEADSPIQPEVTKYRLLERTTFMKMPPETAPWEMPVWPVTGRTWPPGATGSIHNSIRVLRALSRLFQCLTTAPRLTFQALNPGEYRYQAASLSALYRLAALSRIRKRYDVLHAHFGPVGNSFRFARDLWRAPLIVSFHGYDFCTAPRQEGSDMYHGLFATADTITVNSEYTRKRVSQLGCPSTRLHKIPVGLDPAVFTFHERHRKPEEPVRILVVGRLVAIKGHEYCIRAVAKLRDRHPGVRLEIVGDGPLRKTLEELAAKLDLQQIVTFSGACDGVTLNRLMAESHLFVLPSVSIEGDQEGQGLVLQEAQACGLPVIATDSGGLPEGILPGQTGFLVPERDADALAERLAYFIEHPEILPIMGRKGRDWVEECYDIGKLNRQLVELYARTIADYRTRNE
ncbi:MAG TPA: glycosyltransferase [Verrucomicrobiae bacterium]|nr:glycosyltransferase [Verrucomicrobiae bacterium]